MDAIEQEVHRQRVRAVCADRGISITPSGEGFRLTGCGISLFVADVAAVRLDDLRAPMMRQRQPRYRFD